MSSIRVRLLSWLLGSVTVVAVAAAWGVYQSALVEIDAVADYHLRQLALSLRDQGVAESLPDPEQGFDFVVQIWSEDGVRVYMSQPHSRLPDRATLGFGDLSTRDGVWRVYATQVRGRTIQVAQPMSVRRELARSHALRTLLPMFALLPLLALAVWFGVQRALRPIAAVAGEVRRRDPDSLEPLPEGDLPEEFVPLARALNTLLGRLGATLESQRMFVADAAHELRSPLTALRLQVQLLDRARDPGARRDASAQLAAGLERAVRVVNQLLTLARSEHADPAAAPSPVRLDEVARQAVGEVAAQAEARGVDLGVTAAEHVTVQGEADALRALARNLVENAVHYTPGGGRVDVSVRGRSGEALLEVADTGPGIAAADRERVFGRFFRRPAASAADPGGSGLGLAIVRAVAERHGGRIELGSAPGGGLLARVTFPIRAR
ncbi:MAG TPA: ATP-binding protein [Burkholderiales bacterium]|nr:ATP-binding protein [Burkholderiales bacterium]